MHVPITVNYIPDGEDWRITVTDEDRTQNATASGLIAARDQADQIVDKMVPEQAGRTVVHLLEGDAVAFTNTYLQARLGLSAAAQPQPAATEGAAPEGAVPAQATATEAAPPRPTVPARTPSAAEPTAQTLPAGSESRSKTGPAPDPAPQGRAEQDKSEQLAKSPDTHGAN